MADSNIPVEQPQQAKDKIILEAVKHLQENGAEAVSSEEIAAYIVQSKQGKYDQDEINAILKTMTGEDGPLVQLEHRDGNKFQLKSSKTPTTEGLSSDKVSYSCKLLS